MTSKEKSPSQKQSSLESFVNSSNDCIVIPDTLDEFNKSSTERIKSPAVILTPITKHISPVSYKDSKHISPVSYKDSSGHTASRDVDLYVSLDALAIVRNADIQGTEEVHITSPKSSVDSPMTSPNVTADISKSAVKRKPRRPKNKSEMSVEWEKLKEEKRDIAARKREIDKIKAELEREREKLKKQIERNEERETEKELKASERDSKLKRKEEMLDTRNKEREMRLKQKETQLQEKENDRNKTEEERVRRKDKEQAEQERFKSFFVSKPSSLKRQQNVVYQYDTRFVPFQIKDNMKLAIFPSKQIDYEEFDAYLSLETHEFDSNTLLAEMKYRRSHNMLRDCQPMELQTQNENDIMIVSADEKMCRGTQSLTVRFKLLQFVENQRPAYFGTFFKRSSLVTGRRPIGRDSTIMDYEVYSDEEWEPEDPDAESIKSNDSDEEVSGSQNDSDSEDGFFVPHGYLSADEGHASEENDEYSAEIERDPMDSFEEKRKRKLQAKEEAWLSQINQKCQPLKPFIISRLSALQLSADSLTKINKCTAVLLVDDPLDTLVPPGTLQTRHKSVTDLINTTALPYFIQYIHEEIIGVDRAVMQFCIFWNEHYLPSKYLETQPDQLNVLKVNKYRLIKTMHKIAKKIDYKVWVVNEEFLCTKVLDVNVKNEIKKLFPSKTNVKLNESQNEKPIPSSPAKEPVAKHFDKTDIKKFTSPKITLAITKLIHNETPGIDLTKTESKSISSFKRKSLSEMRSVAVKIIPQTPISPPETSVIKRVKLSTSTTSIEEIIIVDSPLKHKATESRRLNLGAAQTDSKGACIHVWK